VVNLQSNGAYWCACWTDSTGRRRRKSLGPKAKLTRDDALAACRQIELDFHVEPGLANAGGPPNITQWTDRYLAEREHELGDRTYLLHEKTVEYLKRYFRKSRRIDKITRSHAAAWRAWLVKQDLADATVCGHVRTAKVIFRMAKDVDLVPFNPFDRLRGTARPADVVVPDLTEQDIAKLVDAANSPQWRCLVGLCAYAGLRLGEARALTWSEIKWGEGRIELTGESTSTKNHRRPVRMEIELEQLLLEAFETLDDDGPARASKNNLQRNMTALIRRAGFEPWAKPFHALRGWRATTWRQRFPEHVVDKWLGHSQAVARLNYAAVPDSYYHSDADEDTIQPMITADQIQAHVDEMLGGLAAKTNARIEELGLRAADVEMVIKGGCSCCMGTGVTIKSEVHDGKIVVTGATCRCVEYRVHQNAHQTSDSTGDAKT